MKLLLLVDWAYPCDHQFLNTVYAENFIDRGHEITWVMRPEDDAQDTITQESWNNSDVYILPQSSYSPAQTTFKSFIGRLNSHTLLQTDIDFTEYDLVHVRNDLSMGLIASKLSAEFRMPYVHQISHLKADSLIEEANLGFQSKSSWIKGHLGRRLRKHVSQSADLVLPISEEMKTLLKQRGYTTAMQTLSTGTKIVNSVPNGQDFIDEYGITSDYTLLYMGSMSPSRRLEFLFDVVENVNKRYDIELVMVGGRKKSNQNRLKMEANSRDISNIVTFTGWISDRSKIRSAVAAADIGLSPFPTDSILRTNAPIKTLEYMSLGTPVVASNTFDQQSVLATSRGGLPVEYNVSRFVFAIEYLLSSNTTRYRMGENGKAYINNNRNFVNLTDRTERIYQELLNKYQND